MDRHHGFLGLQNDIGNRGASSFVFCRFLIIAYIMISSLTIISFRYLQAVAQMAAIGFGLPKDAFTSLMKQVSNAFCLGCFITCVSIYLHLID